MAQRLSALLLICMTLLLPTGLRAAEVDQFTRAEQRPADSRTLLNREVMRRLAYAVDMANRPQPKPVQARHHPPKKIPQCDAERLYDSVSWQLARPVVGQVESFAEQNAQIARRTIPFEQTVYRDFLWSQSPTLVLSKRVASVINVAGTDIGTDKLGHFFTEGHSYFTTTSELADGPEQGLLFGEWSESVYFGAQTTGVFSYADLVANFNGLRFWNRLLGRQPDPLTGAVPEPYVRCDGKRWQLSGEFDWADYVDNGWSERVNCSLMRTPELLADVLQHAPLCARDELPLDKYHAWSTRLMNTMGLAVLPDYLQPEVILAQRSLVGDLKLPPETLEYMRELRQQLEVWRLQAQAMMEEP